MEEKEQLYQQERYYSSYKERRGFWYKLKEYRSIQKYTRNSKRAIGKAMKASGQEALETKEMAKSFFKLLESKLDLSNRKEPPTPEEVKIAIEQLKDVGRFSVFTAISILPAGGLGLIGLEVLARKMGVKNFTFLPSAFRDSFASK